MAHFQSFSSPFVFIALLPPWLTVDTLFLVCREAPCGPRRFRQFLIFAMIWYTGMAVSAEILDLVVPPAPVGHFPTVLARALVYGGAISFVVLIREGMNLRRCETNGIQ